VGLEADPVQAEEILRDRETRKFAHVNRTTAVVVMAMRVMKTRTAPQPDWWS
jgi:hypothetical protein